MDDGEADADAEDVGADGETMTIAQALERGEGELAAMKQKRADAAAMCVAPARPAVARRFAHSATSRCSQAPLLGQRGA